MFSDLISHSTQKHMGILYLSKPHLSLKILPHDQSAHIFYFRRKPNKYVFCCCCCCCHPRNICQNQIMFVKYYMHGECYTYQRDWPTNTQWRSEKAGTGTKMEQVSCFSEAFLDVGKRACACRSWVRSSCVITSPGSVSRVLSSERANVCHKNLHAK